MKEDFVPYKLAVKLKEKGFKELCLAYYTNDDTLYYKYSHKAGACYKDCYLSHNFMPKDSVSGKFVDAPTISQVLKWLREEKNIYVALDFFHFNGNTELWWTYSVRYIEDDSTENIFESCKRKSWEQAALAGIEYVIDNLI